MRDALQKARLLKFGPRMERAAGAAALSGTTIRGWEAGVTPNRADAVERLRAYIVRTLKGDPCELAPDVFTEATP